MSTTILGLPLMFEGQTGNETQYNEMITWVDALLRKGAIDALATPPGSPTEGDTYLVAATATGGWTGKEDYIATYIGTAWKFVPPTEGWRLWLDDVNEVYVYDGSNWVVDGVKSDSVAVTGSVSKFVGRHIIKATATLTLTLPNPTAYTSLEQDRTIIELVIDGSYDVTLNTPSGTFRSALAAGGVAAPVVSGPYVKVLLETDGTDWIARTIGIVA